MVRRTIGQTGKTIGQPGNRHVANAGHRRGVYVGTQPNPVKASASSMHPPGPLEVVWAANGVPRIADPIVVSRRFDLAPFRIAHVCVASEDRAAIHRGEDLAPCGHPHESFRRPAIEMGREHPYSPVYSGNAFNLDDMQTAAI